MTSHSLAFPFSLNIPRWLRYCLGSLKAVVMMTAAADDSRTDRQSLISRFNSIIGQHDGMISKICFGYANSIEEFDDLRQDSLINIWNALPGFQGKSSVRTWIYRITLNTCVSTLRKRPKLTVGSIDDGLYNLIDENSDRKQLLKEMHECISLLPPVDKAIMLLWLDEFSYEEIADMTGLPRNTVATRLRRAKISLQKI